MNRCNCGRSFVWGVEEAGKKRYFENTDGTKVQICGHCIIDNKTKNMNRKIHEWTLNLIATREKEAERIKKEKVSK